MSKNTTFILPIIVAFLLSSCGHKDGTQEVDYLISGGTVFSGEKGDRGKIIDVGIRHDKIVFIGDYDESKIASEKIIDATGLIVSPGFIDPHTHALDDLKSSDRNQNVNYLTQGVTTVFTGSDGYGPIGISETANELSANEIGTNVGLFIGHGTIRKAVVGSDDRPPTKDELVKMRKMVTQAMEEGSLGLSAGLYYAPGSFAQTDELIELAKESAKYGGIYESHIRDESSYSIGLLAAIEEAIEIGAKSGAGTHIAHLKALGVDVWGQSSQVIELIETAHKQGKQVTADQYPWSASGTRLSNALIPNWAKAGGKDEMHQRLRNPDLRTRFIEDIAENLRKRGGASSLLIVSGTQNDDGTTLEQAAERRKASAVDATIEIVLEGDARVASFNMKDSDIEAFMKLDWVMTSSDGTNGHPRKYASFPRKFETYVSSKRVLSIGEFIRRSTGLVADTFKICGRGYIKDEYFADIVVFDPKTFSQKADFKNPKRISPGVNFLFVNGHPSILDRKLRGDLTGQPIFRGKCSNLKSE